MIETDISKRSCKLKKVHGVEVESRLISKNEQLSSSLIEIATSSGNKFLFYDLFILILSLIKNTVEKCLYLCIDS